MSRYLLKCQRELDAIITKQPETQLFALRHYLLKRASTVSVEMGEADAARDILALRRGFEHPIEADEPSPLAIVWRQP